MFKVLVGAPARSAVLAVPSAVGADVRKPRLRVPLQSLFLRAGYFPLAERVPTWLPRAQRGWSVGGMVPGRWHSLTGDKLRVFRGSGSSLLAHWGLASFPRGLHQAVSSLGGPCGIQRSILPWQLLWTCVSKETERCAGGWGVGE